MVNEIRAAIAECLDGLVPEAEIYMGDIAQGFTGPCFFILASSSEQKQVIKDRYVRQHVFDVQYFPRDTYLPAAELGKAEALLWMALEYVELADGPIRGTEMRTQIMDGVLHFFVQYDVFVMKKQKQLPVMEKLRQVQKIKE